MATEEQYDDVIAPMLADVAAKCKELGMSLVARVEWEPNESGITLIGECKGIGQILTRYAALSRGNIDSVCLALLKNHDVSQSVFLSKWKDGPS